MIDSYKFPNGWQIRSGAKGCVLGNSGHALPSERTIQTIADVVAGQDCPQLIHAVALRAPGGHFIRGIAETQGRLTIAPLLLQIATVDPRIVAVPLEMPVHQMRFGDGPLPAGTVVQVTRLASPDMLIEINIHADRLD